MLIWLITLAAKVGVPTRLAKLAAWGMAALIIVIALTAMAALFHNWLQDSQDNVVAVDRASVSAEVSNRVIAADREANANAMAADVVAQQNEKELDDAARNDNAVQSVLDRLRQQQDAGSR